MRLALCLIVVAGFDLLAFRGLRLSMRADGNRKRTLALGVVYWMSTAAVLGAALGYSFFGARDSDRDPRMPEAVIVAVVALYFSKVVLAILTLLDLVRRGVVWSIRRALSRPVPPWQGLLSRTRLLPRIGLALAAFTLCAILWSATLGRSDVRVYRHTILSDSLPAEFDGLRIVHLSDMHASSLGTSAPCLADRLIAAVNAERPDLIVYSGDYGEPADFERGPEILGRLRARFGKYAVLGNHDFGSREHAADNWTSPDDKRRKIDAFARTFQSRGFRLLMNDAAVLASGSNAIAVLGVGVFDPHHGFDDADLAAAQRAAPAAGFRLLLAHSPQYWETSVQGKRSIDLTLSGHTHGAQIGIGFGPYVWSPAALEFRHWGGLYRQGQQYLNVNRGTGCVGLPVRLNMPADVSLIIVRSSRAASPPAWT